MRSPGTTPAMERSPDTPVRKKMADVQIQQPSGSGSGSGGSGQAWAIVVLILLGIIAWFVFGGGLHRTSRTRVDINVPNAGAPASGSAPSGSAPPSGGAAPSNPGGG